MKFRDIFFYQHIIIHTFKQYKHTITRYKYFGSTWEKHKKKFLIKKLSKNNKINKNSKRKENYSKRKETILKI